MKGKLSRWPAYSQKRRNSAADMPIKGSVRSRDYVLFMFIPKRKHKKISDVIRFVGTIFVIFFALAFMAVHAGYGNRPCSGKKGGISHCQGTLFVCNDGSHSQSKRSCVVTGKTPEATPTPSANNAHVDQALTVPVHVGAITPSVRIVGTSVAVRI